MSILRNPRSPVLKFALSVLLTCLCAAPAQAEHYKVVLMGGQSNMFGFSTEAANLPGDLQGSQEDVLFYYGTFHTFLQSGSGGTWGSEISFGRTIADAFPEEKFMFIKHSDGGTSLWNEWNLTNGRSYNLFKEVVGFGLDTLARQGHTYEIVAMLWSQGERDAWNDRTTEQYQNDFEAFIADIRSRYGADLPFFFTRLSVKQTARPIEAVRLAQDYVAARDPNTHLIDADAYGILGDNLHYTEQGYIDMGHDFAQAYINTRSGGSTTDETAPRISSLTPFHDASGVRLNSALRIAFSEEIVLGTGSITLRKSDGSLVETYDAANPPANLTLSGNTLEIDPSVDFLADTSYYIEIDATAIDDLAGHSFAGFSGDGTWSFTTAGGLINGSRIVASASAPSMGNTAFNFNQGVQAWHPYRTIDGSGLSGGEHGTADHTAWLTRDESIQGVRPEVAESYIQWDLGGSYPLDSIHLWNAARSGDTGTGIRSVDIYYSNIPFPGDPEGEGAANWTRLGGSSLELPQAPATGNIGFDLETATSITLPTTEVRYLRFEVNSNWNGDDSYTGIAEIQFTAAAGSTDSSSPGISVLSPANGASSVEHAANLRLTFTEDIALGSGSITLRQSGGAAVESFDVGTPSSTLSVSGATLTIHPSNLLAPSTGYHIEIDGTAIEDLAGNSFAGISGDSTWSFTTEAADNTAPGIQAQSPRPDETEVNPAANIILVFDEAVAFGTGNITLRQSGGAAVESFDVAAPGDGLSLSGATLTINPTAALADSTTFYVEIDATAIDDLAGNSFAGISGSSAWNFTTVVPDVTPPGVASLTPASGANDFFPSNNLVIVFDEYIALGTGFIRIRRVSDDSVVESFDVASPASGFHFLGDTITLNPASDLPLGTDFYVEIESTAILDNAGNSYPGTSGSTTWNFSVPATVTYPTISYVDTQYDIETGDNNTTIGWRNTNPAKSLDIDGDNIVGSDGYWVAAGSVLVLDPPYAVTERLSPGLNGPYGGRVFDDPTNAGGNDVGLKTLHDSSAGKGQESAPLLGFEITQDLPAGTTLRVGILVDANGSPDPTPNTASYTLKQTFGGTATATSTPIPWTGESMDVVYFDLIDLQPTHQFVITCTTSSSNTVYPSDFEQVLGLTFDTGTSGPDETPPEVGTFDPAHTETGVSLSTNLSVAFNENVAFGTGTITLHQSGGTLVESFDVANPPAGLTLAGNTVTIDPAADLSPSTTYYIEIEATAIDDLAGNSFAGFIGDSTWSFTTGTPDLADPQIQSFNPTNGASAVRVSSSLVITFDEAVAFGSGTITLRQSGGALVESFDVANPGSGLSLSGSTLTISPSSNLAASTGYYIEIDATAIDDLSGNSFAGFSGDGTWSFTTADVAQGATISYVDAQFGIEDDADDPTSGWRNTTPAKPLDIDGDNILGTDGYHLHNLTSAPSYGTVTVLPGASGFGPYGSAKWDDPNNPGGADLSGDRLFRQDGGYTVGTLSIPILQFEVTGTDLDGRTLRLGILCDAIADGSGTASYTITQTSGSGTDSVTSDILTYDGNALDVAFFDITGAVAGDVFVIQTTTITAPGFPNPANFQQFVGFTFDSDAGGSDTTPPDISSLSPANTATGAAVATDLSITFNEDVAFGTGSISLRESGGALVESFDVAGPAAGLNLSGSTVTINPTSDLADSTGYYVEIDATAIDDLAGNSFAGFTGDGTWSFTTVEIDNTAPGIQDLNPGNGAIDVPTNTGLVITFDEDVAFGTGSITLRESGGALVESFDVAGPAAGLSLSGSTVTINPTSDLADSTTYYIEIDSTAVDDPSGNSFAGFSGEGTWSFSTAESTTPSGIVPTGYAYGSGGSAPSGTAGGDADSLLTDDIISDGAWNDGKNVYFDAGDSPAASVTFTFAEAIAFATIEVYEHTNLPSGIASVEVSTSTDGITFSSPTSYAFGTGTAVPGTTYAELHTLDVSGLDAAKYLKLDFYANSGSWMTLTEIDFTAASGPGNTFADWTDGFTGLGGLTGLDDDPDGDGLANGLEAWFGTHPGQFNVGLEALSTDGITATFTHPQAAETPSDLHAIYQWSPNLEDWYAGDGLDGPPGGPTATIAPSTSGTTTTVITTPNEGMSAFFLRLRVEQIAP
ncbi:Ig-like domain-containing protein [Haloferula sp. A504]|uniref:Ig-like domain-containing protein n=1 Tax=Haloferula sp. A504 TaxID=3373601 RepID=UPI0031BD65D3|nr:Ig-like domain-containing protein [Verrucomicrobiaceae bacterium E54]